MSVKYMRNPMAALVASLAVASCAGTTFAEEARHLDAQAMSASNARAQCAPELVKAGETCAVEQFDRIGTVGAREFSFALYRFEPSPDNPRAPLPYARVIVFERLASSMVRPLLVSADDSAFFYDTPVILHSAGRVLLHIPATEDGTGNFNRETLYVWVNDGWRDIDVTSWLTDLEHRLPKGLTMQKGVYPNYATMSASTLLWRAKDAVCCGTGGRAAIRLEWQGDRVALGSYRIEPAGKSLSR
jgi:hypothetical protein